ncbi:MAG: hypothetical protein GX268_05475 [Methanomicrobiales archaeon]|nr:hypothetical protein [Methanomicrobiales archaeon]
MQGNHTNPALMHIPMKLVCFNRFGELIVFSTSGEMTLAILKERQAGFYRNPGCLNDEDSNHGNVIHIL